MIEDRRSTRKTIDESEQTGSTAARRGVGVKPTTTHPSKGQPMIAPPPVQKLDVYVQARELARAVHEAAIGDAELRDRATRAAKSTLLNLAEGLPDTNIGVRRRHFAIARNSLC